MKRKLYLFVSVIFLCMMLLMPAVTKEGAVEGLLLWYQNMLPSMLPYTIISLYILGQTKADTQGKRKNQKLSRLPGIDKDAVFVCLTGFLCGYPLGAKMTGQLVRTKRLSLEEGQYLLSFCNNASPAFLLQFVSLGLLHSTRCAPALMLSIYGAAVLTALILYPHYRRQLRCKRAEAAVSGEPNTAAAHAQPVTMSSCIMDACEAMVRLCGYMVLFSIITKMVTAHITAVTTRKAFLIGIIEITNGAHVISGLCSPAAVKLKLLAFCISFGGISCCAQSSGMCAGSGLSMPRYLFSKAGNAVLSFLIMHLLCSIGFV